MTAATIAPDTAGTSWAPVQLDAIIAAVQAGEIAGPVPRLMLRTDGVPLLYPGELHSIAGEPEAGKTWLALAEAARLLTAGERVLYLDFEDSAPSVVARLLALGADPHAIADRLAYVHPNDQLEPAALAHLLAGPPFALAVLDGLSEAYALLGLDADKNRDIPVFMRALPRPIAATGAVVLLLDHVVKNGEQRGRWAIGAQHKLAGVAVAYTIDAITPASRAHAGTSKLHIAKDRPGHVRGHAHSGVIGLVRIEPENGGERVVVRIEPPDSTTEQGTFRPTTLMARVAAYVDANPGASKRAIREGVTGKTNAKDIAIATLVAEGWIEVRAGARGASHHYLRTPFDPDTPCPRDPTVPQRDPGTVAQHRAPVPLPLKGGTGTVTVNGTPPEGATVPRDALTADCHDDEGA